MTLAPLPPATDILAVRDDRDRAAAVAQLREDLTEAVSGLAMRASMRRPTTSGRPSPAALAGEADTLAAAAGTLRQLAGVLADAAKLADEHLVDAMRDHLGDTRTTAKIPTQDGGVVEVTATQPRRVTANTETVEDVLAGWAAAEAGPDASTAARAARATTQRVLAMVASDPKWRTTAVTAAAAQLVQAGESALAERLTGAVVRHDDKDRPESIRVKATRGDA